MRDFRDVSIPAWERELAGLHASLPPRFCEPLRRLIRAQLGRWWLHSALGAAAVIAIGGGAFAWAVDDEFKRGVGTGALGVLPILVVGHLVAYVTVWLLARDGQMHIAWVGTSVGTGVVGTGIRMRNDLQPRELSRRAN